MFKKLGFALKRQVTPSNMLESLAECFGMDSPFLIDTYDPGQKGRAMGYGDAITFSNLVAEALIRDLDLKKGERVVVINPNPKDLLLIGIGVMKSGGMLVPLEPTLDGAEIRRRAEAVMADLAIVDGRVLTRCPELLEGLKDSDRLLVSGSYVVEGREPLYNAVGEGSGFFIPYTFKPTSVLALFFGGGGAEAEPVMATSRMLVSGSKLLAPLLPVRVGDLVMSAAPLTRLSGFCTALLALATGARLSFSNAVNPVMARGEIEEQHPAMFIAEPGLLREMAEQPPADWSPKIFLSTGSIARETSGAFAAAGRRRIGPLRLPPLFVSLLSTRDTTGIAALRVELGSRMRSPILKIPPNRVCVDSTGRYCEGSGRLLVKGPAVTPGFWNDLDESLSRIRDGWFDTGVDIER
jgi:acyl-CoA synthetase (AMP-forming)/AMP-acid ligase II